MNKEIYMADSFVEIPDLKCSFVILHNKETIDDDSFLIKIDDGKYKGIVISIDNIKFIESSTLTFNYSIIYNPSDKIPNSKTFEKAVGTLVKKIIQHALQIENQKNEETVAKSKLQKRVR